MQNPKEVEDTLRRQLLLSRAINEIAKSISAQDDPDLILEDTVRIIGAALGVDRALIYDISFEKHQAIGLFKYQLGVNSYISKPVEFNEFAKTVSELGLYRLLVNHPPVATKQTWSRRP